LARKRDFRRITRGLRFRLTASYALFFALLLIGVALLFRERLSVTLDSQAQEALNQEFGALRGYLRIEKEKPIDANEKAAWYYDEDDPDESTVVLDMKKIYLITDADGNVVTEAADNVSAVSTGYKELGIDPPAQIQARVREAMASYKPNSPGKIFWTEKRNPRGEPILIRGGIVFDEGRSHRPYYVAIGTSLTQYNNILRQFTWILVIVIPLALILGSLLGGFMAGRALTPVMDVAQAAQRISGSNLSLRIPSRQAGDELDYLILTFNRMIDRLEASFQQMKQFSADVSHEMRTPITAIRGQLEVALFTAKSTDQYREAMFNALQDIDRLSQMVRALLLLSQAESGQLALQKSRLDLTGVMQDLVEQFQIPAEVAGVRLTSHLPPECRAELDRVQIERMVTNLLSNAIKFTSAGGKVSVSVTSLPEHVEIVVEDTGLGIPREYLPHIFDRFYRVPGSGTAPGPEQGLGLGLSFVAWIVKAHGGKIEVDSMPGKGTRFTIELPTGETPVDAMELAGQPAGMA
jgi:heavy metal sensor kinase